MTRKRVDVLTRLMDGMEIRKPNECWPWLGSIRGHMGYGSLHIGRGDGSKVVDIHRLSWILANGRPIPEGKMVTHTCNNPPCGNPAHLRLGTEQSNMYEKADAGPETSGYKLSLQQVQEIR